METDVKNLLDDVSTLFQKISTKSDGNAGGDTLVSNLAMYLTQLLHAAQDKKQDSKVQIQISCAIKRVVTVHIESGIPLNSGCYSDLVEYLRGCWDAAADVIGYDAHEIFLMLLQDHSRICESCAARNVECEFSQFVMKTLTSDDSARRSRYRFIHGFWKFYKSNGNLWLGDSFFAGLYQNLSNDTLSTTISELLVADMSRNSVQSTIHVISITDCLLSKNEALRKAIKTRLLPMMMKRITNAEEIVILVLNKLSETNAEEGNHYVEALFVLTRFLVLSQKRSTVYKTWQNYVSSGQMARAVVHKSIKVRIAALNLVSEHPKPTEKLTAIDMTMLDMFFRTNMAEQCPATRQKILAALKKVLIRMGETTEQWIKSPKLDTDGILDIYVKFTRDLIELSFESLDQTANFNRRIMSLYIIDMIFLQRVMVSNGKERFANYLDLDQLLTRERYLRIISMLDDSFQLCQNTALHLLKRLPLSDLFDMNGYLVETKEMMLSMKSHSTLASGFRLQLYASCNPSALKSIIEEMVASCEDRVRKIKQDLMNITTLPLHTLMNSVYLLLEQCQFVEISESEVKWWTNFSQNRLLPICFEIAELVSPVVHSMSPEGYIPTETLHKMTGPVGAVKTQLQAETSQLLLACCWRTHRHVSQILAWAVKKLFGIGALSSAEVSLVGDYFWLQLTECRHCGAFECAVEGFTSLCSFLWTLNEDEQLPSPKKWLTEILLALEGKQDSMKLCSTRRSAGLPHLVVAICATEPHGSTYQTLNRALLTLLEQENKDLIYRIHSLNVLKAIFASSALGDKVTLGLEWALRVAVSGCAASSWRERNSAAQLMATLRSRVFGVARSQQRSNVVDDRNRMTSHEFFTKFPSLYDYLGVQLEVEGDEFSLYPILIVLTHLTPSPGSVYSLSPFVHSALKIMLSCRAEKLRRLAAVAVTTNSDLEDSQFIVSWLTTLCTKQLSSNVVHSILLLLDWLCFSADIYLRQKSLDCVNQLMLQMDHMVDLNLNLMCELIRKLGLPIYQVTPNKGHILAKRALALQMLQCVDCPSEEETRLLEVRLEVYRHVIMGNMPVWKNANSWLVCHLISDVQQEVSERDTEMMMCTLFDLRNSLSAEDVRFIVNMPGDRWRMPGTLSAYHRLIASVWTETSLPSSTRKWLAKSMTSLDDEGAELRALEVLRFGLERDVADKEIIGILVSFLQTDSLDVREQASTVAAGCGLTSTELAPDVAYRILSHRHAVLPVVHMTDEVEVEIGNGLFDSVDGSLYAENRTFGAVEPIITFVDQLDNNLMVVSN